MKTLLLVVSFSLFLFSSASSQSCTPQGNQTSYGTNNVWRGYVYNNADLTSYKGYVTKGTSSNPNFDENFGGDNVSYTTNGCPVETSTFSVRYKLTKSFSNGVYEFTVGGDDGFRLSLDGGSTWVINRWYDQSYTISNYTVQLNGSYNMVLEFYENGGANRISFAVTSSCTGLENTATYGTGNVWRGYVYDGTNFDTYRGMIQAGANSNPAFDQNFGGSNTTFSTSGCSSVSTETFSVRYRLSRTFTAGNYTFFVGGDDGYRLSLNGGSTWVINKWNDQSYNVSSYAVTLTAGTYNLVLEYYENSGDNRINFFVEGLSVLPVRLVSFSGNVQNSKNVLDWKIAGGSNPDHFEVEKSVDGANFQVIGRINAAAGNTQTDMTFSYTDASAMNGKSYYRLKMTDLTGTVTYSGVIILSNAASKEEGLNVFPTILTGTNVSIYTGKKISQAIVAVVDIKGNVIGKTVIGKLNAGQTVSFSTSNYSLPKGIYFIRVTDNYEPVDTKRIVVM
ncbi:MAG: T9SS type A sorting domain-containing protein [Chitinophagaceae bacterium]|nr:T9SS type A sorting domain-containing protein [Chitinophagaceae bacterium]